jgi:hypothetical protein
LYCYVTGMEFVERRYPSPHRPVTVKGSGPAVAAGGGVFPRKECSTLWSEPSVDCSKRTGIDVRAATANAQGGGKITQSRAVVTGGGSGREKGAAASTPRLSKYGGGKSSRSSNAGSEAVSNPWSEATVGDALTAVMATPASAQWDVDPVVGGLHVESS